MQLRTTYEDGPNTTSTTALYVTVHKRLNWWAFLRYSFLNLLLWTSQRFYASKSEYQYVQNLITFLLF